MMDPMSTVEKIVKLALLINKAMDAVQQNNKACGDIRRTVDTVSSIASRLKKNAAAMKDKATRNALDHLEKTLQLALKLVKECHTKQNRLVSRLLSAPDLSKQLRDVKQDISHNVNVLNLALNSLAHDQRAGGALVPTLFRPWQRPSQSTAPQNSKTLAPQAPRKAVVPLRKRS